MENKKNIVKLIEDKTLEFEGVSKFPKKGRKNIAGEYNHPSIKVSETDGEYTISIEILVSFGINIPQLCYDIQTGLIRSLAEYEGIVVKTVNIIVDGIYTA